MQGLGTCVIWVRSLQCYYNVFLVFVGMCAETITGI